MGRLGMDVDVVESVGRGLRARGQSVESVVRTVDGLIASADSHWWGARGRQFVDEWRTVHRPALLGAAQAVSALGRSALGNATEQRTASAGGGPPAALIGADEDPAVDLMALLERVVGVTGATSDSLDWLLKGGDLKAYRGMVSDALAIRAESGYWGEHGNRIGAVGALLTFAQEAFKRAGEDVNGPHAVNTGAVWSDVALTVSHSAVTGGCAALGGIVGGALGLVGGPAGSLGAGTVGAEAGAWVGNRLNDGVDWFGDQAGGLAYDGWQSTTKLVTVTGEAVAEGVWNSYQGVTSMVGDAAASAESVVDDTAAQVSKGLETVVGWWRGR